MHNYPRLYRGVVIDFADFYLPLLHGCENRGYKRGCGLAERKFGDHKSLVIEFLYFGAHFHRAATRAIVILRCVHQPTGLEIGKEREGAPVQTVDGRVENLVEVMRQNLGTEAYGYTLHSLGKEQREFHRQSHRLLLAPVVTGHPLGDFRRERGLDSKLRQSRLDVTRCGRRVAGQDISPVSLSIYEKFLLSELHESISDRGVSVRVILHGIAHDVGHFVEMAVINGAHRMQNTSLHRLESILDVRHRTLENHV